MSHVCVSQTIITTTSFPLCRIISRHRQIERAQYHPAPHAGRSAIIPDRRDPEVRNLDRPGGAIVGR